ncbi:hypothetical protein BDW42DRAFT_175105 [Aspergillus taichungensis]|uniref:Uncharacterized protein n=1 Tax=Aspergillus taichungensis TaxID=482145 RepID=A0A2J5HMU2_9EURO|nr:hypothetical protein BDW42DRAFT_175105 [Aspergillus taichungensis]
MRNSEESRTLHPSCPFTFSEGEGRGRYCPQGPGVTQHLYPASEKSGFFPILRKKKSSMGESVQRLCVRSRIRFSA